MRKQKTTRIEERRVEDDGNGIACSLMVPGGSRSPWTTASSDDPSMDTTAARTKSSTTGDGAMILIGAKGKLD